MPPSELTLTEMVFPNHANHLGPLFSGQALAWMDRRRSSPPRVARWSWHAPGRWIFMPQYASAS